jgi:hypothetical protein
VFIIEFLWINLTSFSTKIHPNSILTALSLFRICCRRWVSKGSMKAGIDSGVRSVLGIFKLFKCYDFVICHVWVVVPFMVERIP